MTEEREMTALDAPVGAGAGQSLDLAPTIIPDYGEDFNPTAEEMFEAQMQYEQEMQAQAQAERESAPGFMQTVSMPELYEMVYPANRRSLTTSSTPALTCSWEHRRSARAL